MRKWFGMLVVVACICCLPVVAQESKDANANETAKSSEAPKTNLFSAPAAVSKSPWALPAQPRTTPFPGPAPAAKQESEAPGRVLPRYEIAAGYSYINFNPGDPFNSFGPQGGTGSFTVNATRLLGLTAEIGSYGFTRNLGGTQTDGGMTTWLFGPRLNLRRFDHFVPFTEYLFGGARSGGAIAGTNKNVFALALGGGVDVVINKNIAWRFAQIDYLMTDFDGANVGSSARQNNFRVGTGLVLRFGIPNPPPPPNHPPVAACAVTPASIVAGSSDAVSLHVNASDPDGDPLTYSYTATGGAIEGTGADARWNPSGLAAGTYTATAKVDDGKGGTASCSADLKVEPKPHHPPTVSCSTDRSPINPGEKTGITATGNSPDGLPLTYSYSAAAGQVAGDGAKATFDSTGLAPGSYPVKCAVSDGQPDGTAESSTNVEVKEPPQVKQLEAKLALHSIYFPTAQPTVAKPTGGLLASQAVTLDSLASDFLQYLKYRPAAYLTLEGHADIRGAKDYNLKLSERRVERAKSYLIEKGVPADKLQTKAFGFEHNMTSEEVKGLLEADPNLTPAEKQKLIKNILTVRLANNRRVDVTLSTTGEQSVRQFPFSAKDALTLLSRGGAEKGTAGKAPAGAKPKAAAPKKPAAKP
jgi:outer membrane protein OmpA-like peptidoglycan-associated protein